jgi:serine phosphatase RsbU (regulator of sigma subunit)
MIHSPVNIVFLLITCLLVLISTYLFFRLSISKKSENSVINVLLEKHEEEKLYLNKEISRLNLILDEYKRKNELIQQNFKAPSEIYTRELGLFYQEPSSEVLSANLYAPADESEFKEKNRKLWELTIAVHKEKERINRLKTEIEYRHNEITKSIIYAQRIQKALLSSTKILNLRFDEYFIYWKPKDIVSGDFYWLKRIEDFTYIAVADCTGHGVPGAFMSLLGISFLNDILKDKPLKSSQVLEKLRIKIKMALQQEEWNIGHATEGMDIGLCVINHKTMELDFTGAYNSLYLIRNNEIKIFKTNKNPVGIHPTEIPFENEIFQLNKDDKLYLFSDGFYDQLGGPNGRKFMKNNFQLLLTYISELNISMEEEKEILDETFIRWKGEKNPQIDDILIMGIKI